MPPPPSKAAALRSKKRRRAHAHKKTSKQTVRQPLPRGEALEIAIPPGSILTDEEDTDVGVKDMESCMSQDNGSSNSQCTFCGDVLTTSSESVVPPLCAECQHLMPETVSPNADDSTTTITEDEDFREAHQIRFDELVAASSPAMAHDLVATYIRHGKAMWKDFAPASAHVSINV
ncbi:Aste57867_18559 [Aphanomyces stellatus]|uniref:Aste57867_18559 protein n=1 Tax=Aphanomyces stellatus TaxID=120398 RepID=A0A485LBX1_9STRA|nr:hypothetical protein As57867_018497 [Aphanomyces stellatus]VFT95295.1 Aste57867_18559 [Aphanomyces stellatus]